jgi:hypothetical protein
LWFEVAFLGHPDASPQFDDGTEDADMTVPGVPLAQLLEEYERQCALSNEITAAHPLDEAGRNPGFPAGAATLRWMLIHMVEETARHAGHLDIARELIDGQTGLGPR